MTEFSHCYLGKDTKIGLIIAGSMMIGGAVYSLGDYFQIGMIVIGTATISMGKDKKGESQSTPIGLLFIVLSLSIDSITTRNLDSLTCT